MSFSVVSFGPCSITSTAHMTYPAAKESDESGNPGSRSCIQPVVFVTQISAWYGIHFDFVALQNAAACGG